jgi:predicted Zn-dependent protease
LVYQASLWLLAQQPIEARRVYTRLIDQDPLDPRAGLGLAVCDIALRGFLDAEQRLIALRQRFPYDPRVYDQLTRLYQATGRPAESARMRQIGAAIG